MQENERKLIFYVCGFDYDFDVTVHTSRRRSILKRGGREGSHRAGSEAHTYILLDVLLCSIAEYFYELCRILTSPSAILHNKTSNKRFIIQHAKLFMSVRANFADIYLRGMRDRSMRRGTELAGEIQLTDWSTAGEQGKLVFVVSTTPSLAQCISLGKNHLLIVQVTHQFKFFSLRFLSRKK